jgi:hypothetical protein
MDVVRAQIQYKVLFKIGFWGSIFDEKLHQTKEQMMKL